MHKRTGFTLLEMAVVLAIAAVLIVSVFSAMTLKRTSQLQNMISEYDSYLKAIGEFQDKYHGLPGDMAGDSGYTPQDMWGTDPCGCPCNTANTSKIAATCNGDANSSIGNSTVDGALSASSEWFRAWQQLSDAGFIKGSFTGTMNTTGSAAEAKPGMNVPASDVSGAGWTLMYLLLPVYNGSSDNVGLWRDQYGHVLSFGAFHSGTYTNSPALKPEEALAIDSKIDDGLPGLGKIRAWRTSVLPSCTTSDSSQTSQAYSKSNNTAPTCSLVFLLGF